MERLGRVGAVEGEVGQRDEQAGDGARQLVRVGPVEVAEGGPDHLSLGLEVVVAGPQRGAERASASPVPQQSVVGRANTCYVGDTKIGTTNIRDALATGAAFAAAAAVIALVTKNTHEDPQAVHVDAPDADQLAATAGNLIPATEEIQ